MPDTTYTAMHIIEEALVGLWERKAFPVSLCTIQNPRESTVFDSEALYLCLLVDPKHPDSARLERLHPYICKEGRKLFYGWTDGHNVSDHFERSVHEDDMRVVAWRLLKEKK